MDFKGYLFLGLLILGLVSLSFWGGRCSAPSVAEIARVDTVWVQDTVWKPVVRLRTVYLTRTDTLYLSPDTSHPGPSDTLYVAFADTADERMRAHLEYHSPVPLHPESQFANVRVDIRDSVKTIHIIERVPQYVETVSIPWMVGALGVGAALGIWIGSR